MNSKNDKSASVLGALLGLVRGMISARYGHLHYLRRVRGLFGRHSLWRLDLSNERAGLGFTGLEHLFAAERTNVGLSKGFSARR